MADQFNTSDGAPGSPDGQTRVGAVGQLILGDDGSLLQNIACSAGGNLLVTIHDGTTAATVRDLASNDALNVAIVDGTGAQITSFGGGTQYADGAARGTATGTLLMVDDGANIQSAQSTTAGVLKVDLSATTANATAVKVDGSAVTQPVSADAVTDTGNSTTALLGNGGNFTGAAFDLTPYSSWSVTVFANVASAANGLKIEWSDDGTNWDFSDSQTFVASAGNMITFGRKARYVRLNYTNGVAPQGTFRVKATGQKFAVRQTRKFVGNAVVDQDTGQVVIAALQGHTTVGGGSWIDVKVNPSGALTVDATNAGTFAVQDSEKVADNAGFTDGTTKVQPAGFIFDEVAGTGLTENDAAAARIDSKRAQVFVVEDATTRGTRATVKAASTAAVAADPALVVAISPNNTIPVGGNVADNGGFTDGTTTVLPAGYIFDEAAGTALTENDAAAARIDSKRAQVFVIEDVTTRGQRSAVKAASTAAVATDPALVVAISPNNTIPTNITSITTYSGKTVNRAVVSAAAAGTLVLAAISGSNKHKVVGAVLTMDVAGTLKFTSGAGPTNLTGAMSIGATGGFVLPTNLMCPYVETAAAEALSLVTTTGTTNGVVLYITEP